MQIDVVAPQDLSPTDVEGWRRLQAGAREMASPFLSPGWAMALAKIDGPDRRQGRVAVVREGREAVGFLPSRVSRFTATRAGALMADYQGLVAPPGMRVDPRELVRALGVRRLDLNNVPADQPTFIPYLRGETPSRIIDLSDGFDAYAKARREGGSDVLQDAAKKRRKFEREHGPVTFTARSGSRDSLDQLIAWKSAQCRATGQTDIFEAGWTAHLVQHLHAAPEPGCEGVLFTHHADGKLAAAHFALLGGDAIGGRVMHAWFIAHDEAFARYSPGVGLIVDILKWCEAEGVRELDLGPGDYRFKLQLANAERAVAYGFVGRPSTATIVRAAQYGVREVAEALPLGRYSALPGKAMRRLDQWRGLR